MATDHFGRAEDRYVSIKSIKSKFSVFQKKAGTSRPLLYDRNHQQIL